MPVILEKRELASISHKRFKIDFGTDDAFRIATLRDYLPTRIDDHAAARINKRWVSTTAIDARDVGLILYRSSPKK